MKFAANKSPDKINMGVGAYRTDEGKPYIFKAVREAEKIILADTSLNKEYLPIDGLAKFNSLTKDLLFGPESSDKVTTVQSLSGTGALRIGAELYATHSPA
jgi:aspartate aminotransferase